MKSRTSWQRKSARNWVFTLILVLSHCFFAYAQQDCITLSADECTVWQREKSFAESVEKHDIKAFAEHLHPDALFSAGTKSPLRGKEAVIKAWSAFVEGKPLILRWRPHFVNIAGASNLAISSGPYVMEDTRPDAKPRFRGGTFSSIWQRDSASGKWFVLFDGGGSSPTSLENAVAAEAFLNQAPPQCCSNH